MRFLTQTIRRTIPLTTRRPFPSAPTYPTSLRMSSSATSSTGSGVASVPDSELAHLSTPTACQHISYFATSIDFERLPGEVVHHAVRYLADSLACALAASGSKEIVALRQLAKKHQAASESENRLLWGTNEKCAPEYAALVNSAATRLLDANDLFIARPPFSALAGGHCSDSLGGVLAFVDPNVNTGQQILSSVIVSYEVQGALASCMAWLERGLHSVSQINFAVPAAAAVFPQYNLTPSIIANACALSGTTGLCGQTWLKQGYGRYKPPPTANQADSAVPTIKFASVGLASQRGVDSVSLAQAGITASMDAIETMVGFFAPPEQPLVFDAFGKLGTEFTMDRHLIKQYAAQFNLQAAITCALDLYRQGVRVADVKSVVVDGHRFLCAGVQGSAEAFVPTSQGSADHSTPYVILMALTHGTFTPATAYANEAWLREDIRAQLASMKLNVVDEFEKARLETGKLGCRVTVTLKDDRVFTASRTTTSGHPDSPLTDDELIAKMNSLLAPIYNAQMASKLWHACLALVDSTDTKATQQLFQLLAAPTRALTEEGRRHILEGMKKAIAALPPPGTEM